MKVLFKRNWLTPDHYRIRVRGKAEVHDIPEKWKDVIPSTAKIVDPDFIIESQPEESLDTLSEFGKYLATDHDRASADSSSQAQEEADATLAAYKAIKTKRNRQAGAQRARDALSLKKKKENENVEVA